MTWKEGKVSTEELRKVMASVDWEFINKEEGGTDTKPYVPKVGESGVTLTKAALDLGQQAVADLQKMLEKDIVKKLAPYTGLKGKAASEYLSRHPLVITPIEAKKIELATKMRTAEIAASQYAAQSGKNFSELHPKVQTAVVSLLHNVGPKGAPKSMAALVQGNLKALAKEITNFKQKALQGRRQRESQLVLDAIRELEGLGG